MKVIFRFLWRSLYGILFAAIVAVSAHAEGLGTLNPALGSDYLRETVIPPGDELDLDVCESWNPEFAGNGMRCCGLFRGSPRWSRKKPRCDVHRNRHSYCSEITAEEKDYVQAVKDGKVGDLLEFLTAQVQHRPIQSFCSVNNGFLVRARPIVPTSDNLIKIRSPERCTNYATEPMVAMLEWLGRQVKKEYQAENPKIHLLLGDVAAPRGGCLAASGGRRGHLSHSTGQDADVGFITPMKNRPSPDVLHKNFIAKENWWFLKQIFHNPYACIKVIFLDRRDIAKLSRVAWNDPEWLVFRKFIRHVRGHNNHFHVRIGDGPGQLGCAPNANPEDEPTEDDVDSSPSDSTSPADGSATGEGVEVE